MLYLFVIAQTATPTPTGTKFTASQEQVDSGLIYVVGAYAAIWLLIFAYLFIMNRRQSQLRREIDYLKQEQLEQTKV